MKRPSQARAKFTVQAIYDAFVRIWRRDGWSGVSTRAIALETGIAVGTFYDYFPNRQALLSGYIRHCIDSLLAAIDQQVIAPPQLTWDQRLRQLLRLSCGVDAAELPYFDAGMLQLEAEVAEPKHHQRVYQELSEKWIAAFAACSELPAPPTADAVRALYLSVWGGRRYLLQIGAPPAEMRRWAAEMERLCRLRVSPPGYHP
ncbi:MAG: TetR/AcrR family transcriptional regulator [Burkholderiaceae bacterium]